MRAIARLSRRHWFYLILPVLLCAALSFSTTYPWAEDARFGEATALFDWCLFVPFLYAICYRDTLPRVLAVRIFALICGGFWVAGKIVPDSAETILAQWSWLRGVGIAVLMLIEGVALVAVLRATFSAAPDPKELERQGVPPLVAKLMLAEARFWRWVWARVRGQ